MMPDVGEMDTLVMEEAKPVSSARQESWLKSQMQSFLSCPPETMMPASCEEATDKTVEEWPSMVPKKRSLLEWELAFRMRQRLTVPSKDPVTMVGPKGSTKQHWMG